VIIAPLAELSLKRSLITAAVTTNLLKATLSSDASLANLLKRYLITGHKERKFAEKFVVLDSGFDEF
jgi:hypothetical protein